MELQSCLAIGLQKITEKHIIFLHVMEYCLIMRAREEAKLLSQEK